MAKSRKGTKAEVLAY
ncbi:uncharacterized protein FFB20_15889 [Fusarium fujikuroi]|nr:uncharacterized protein FFB20_15889 [Fusarium fujikuroi]